MTATLTFPKLDEVDGKIQAKQKELGDIFAEAGEDYDLSKVKTISGDSHDKVAHVRKLNDELTDLGKERDELLVVKAAAERVRNAPDTRGGERGSEPGSGPTGRPSTKSFGELFTESQAYKGKVGAHGPVDTLDVDLKSLFGTGEGWEPEVTRTGRVVEFATRPVQVTDLIPQTTTGQSSVAYMEETLFNNTAAETAESTQALAAQYPEAALELTEKTSPVRKIAVFLPITDEQLEDEPMARGYVNNRLPFMLRQRLDSQILVGNGTAPNLDGILNVAGIQTQAKGTDTVPDAVYKALVKVRVTGRALPNAVVLHPFDWQDIRLLRTTDGIYIWGNPSDAGPERIWGLRVAQTDALTENTGLVGDFANFVELAVRRGIDVQVSNSHGEFFIQGKQAMRADMRVALPVYRPAAFCTVTGI